MLTLSSIILVFETNMIATGQMTIDFNLNINPISYFILRPKLNLILKMKVNLGFKMFNFRFKFDFHFKNNINFNQIMIKAIDFHFETPCWFSH